MHACVSRGRDPLSRRRAAISRAVGWANSCSKGTIGRFPAGRTKVSSCLLRYLIFNPLEEHSQDIDDPQFFASLLVPVCRSSQ
jgi:hypothetical protein